VISIYKIEMLIIYYLSMTDLQDDPEYISVCNCDHCNSIPDATKVNKDRLYCLIKCWNTNAYYFNLLGIRAAFIDIQNYAKVEELWVVHALRNVQENANCYARAVFKIGDVNFNATDAAQYNGNVSLSTYLYYQANLIQKYMSNITQKIVDNATD
jgi:hypothetical protein